jgi:hypothetical protein
MSNYIFLDHKNLSVQLLINMVEPKMLAQFKITTVISPMVVKLQIPESSTSYLIFYVKLPELSW